MLMNRAFAIYCGIVATVLVSSIGLVFVPEAQIGGLQPYIADNGNSYPVQPFGAVAAGRRVYISMGCLYCHSQQVRAEGFGADFERGWGRRSVPRDYIYDSPHLLGTMRTGPDLFNVGVRLPSATWHYQHLYNPRITSPGSIMPAFPFLFDTVKVGAGETTPTEAVALPAGWLPPGQTIVPNDDGRNLVAYLLSMKHEQPLPETGGQ